METSIIFKILFYLLLFIGAYTYILYPIIIKFIASFAKDTERSEYYPSVSILISAYNEEKVILNRLKNIDQLDYDKSNLEVLIGSDLSTDMTNKLLIENEQNYPWLKIFIYDERGGKAGVLNKLIHHVKNDILVFTDANTEFGKESLKKLVQDFSNPQIGGVSGRLILTENLSSRNESVEELRYWEYETQIKVSEGKLKGLIGANGGIFAIRKELFRTIPTERAVTDDFYLSLNVLEAGYGFTYRYDAYAIEETGQKVSAEFKRKIRFSATNFQTIIFFSKLLFNKRFLISFSLWSHKIARWFFPFILLALLPINYLIANEGSIYLYVFYAQLLFYAAALIGLVFSFIKLRMFFFSLPYFFVVANVALAFGFFKFLFNKHSVIWESTKR